MNSLLDPGLRQRARLRSWSLLAGAVVRRFREGRCAQVAASLAFTSLLSLVPFVTLVAVVFSRFPQSQRFAEVQQLLRFAHGLVRVRLQVIQTST